MEKVKVSVKGAGSLEVEMPQYPEKATPRKVLDCIRHDLISWKFTVREIKRGPKKKVRTLDEGSEGNNHD